MKKALLTVLCLLSVFLCFSQQTTTIQLLSSYALGSFEQGRMHVIKPVFMHEGSTLAADSASWNQQLNIFDAYGNVVITQPDGTTIRSDVLNYNGNTRIAILSRNVRMLDKGGALLTTNYLTYNMGTKIGTYTDGGRIVNKQDTLTSKTGYYFENTRDAYFRYNVVINSRDAIVKADTMRYNTETKIATFYGPTHIYTKKDTLSTDLGDYNTGTRQSHGLKNNLYQQGSRTFRGDTIFYDDVSGIGKVNGNITFNDSQEKITMKGDIGVYSRADSTTLITKNAYMIMVTQDSSKSDSLWLTADTLRTTVIPMSRFTPVKTPGLKRDSEIIASGEPAAEAAPARDTIRAAGPDKEAAVPAKDSLRTRVVFAHHHVKIFKSDLQAVTDSLFYSYADSIIRCYTNPMIWSQGSQLSADTVLLQLKNKKLDNMILQHNALIVSTEGDSTKYDQVKGRVVTGIFRNNSLSQLFVDGNAESIKYVKDDTSYTAMNRTVSSRIKLNFENNKLVRGITIGGVEGRFIPIEKVGEDVKILQGFIWKPRDRPKSPESIIPGLRKSNAGIIKAPADTKKIPAQAEK